MYLINKFTFAVAFVFFGFITLPSANADNNEQLIKEIVIETLNFSVSQSLKMAYSLKDDEKLLPASADRFGNLKPCYSNWWVSGFYPGMLWYLYEYSNNEELKEWAQEYTLRVEDQKYTTSNHDVGFIIFCSFGNGYQITKNDSFLNVIQMAANSLSTRFNPNVGCIRSWDYAEWNNQWQYPVIIDNMMNLEILLWAANQFSNSAYFEIAISHANKTIKNHYRPDYSCYHVVSYDTLTGIPRKKNTSQGYSDQSAWSRGQAWGLYGFTMMYRYIKDTIYLNQARKIANYIINHPRLPEDKIPYWDFDAPNIPDSQRDASAGAIICSALIELSQYVEQDLAKQYLAVAEIQIHLLCSSQFRNAPGNNGNFILKHSVGHMPNNTEVNVPIIYADYYFIEALMRYKKLKGF